VLRVIARASQVVVPTYAKVEIPHAPIELGLDILILGGRQIESLTSVINELTKTTQDFDYSWMSSSLFAMAGSLSVICPRAVA
jgi:hypothetical protein